MRISDWSSDVCSSDLFIEDVERGRRQWRYRRQAIHAEPDERERNLLRRAATSADFIVGSVNALSVDGVAVCIEHGGTRVGAYCFGAGKVIRMEGRRVGQECVGTCRCRGEAYRYKIKKKKKN